MPGQESPDPVVRPPSKAYRGPLPIGYVDTRLYKGGRRDWFEAFTQLDMTWAIRMDYVLRHHNVYRRS